MDRFKIKDVRDLTRSQILKMEENEKIACCIYTMGARDIETGVTMEQVIGFGIEHKLTEDYIRPNWHGYKEGDHPWWTKSARMMGIGPESDVSENEVMSIHRANVRKENQGGKGKVMVYWYDPTKEHEIVTRKRTAVKNAVSKSLDKRIQLTDSEKEDMMKSNPGEYRLVNEVLVSEKWIAEHPEKFKEIYG